jgi:CubicO group peptidase (beta-lactamase class C family)
MKSLLFVLTFWLIAAGLAMAADEITASHFTMAAQYSRTHGGLSLRVEQGGRLLFENYARDYSAGTSHKIFSGTKSFVAVAALIADQEGLLSFSEKASDTLTEWRGDRRRSITIDQLLSHTSGLDPDNGLMEAYRDQMAGTIHARLIDTPGARFHYGGVNYEAFGEILRRKLQAKGGGSVEDFIKDKVLDPLDIDLDGWVCDRAGNVLVHSGMVLTPGEWAKFGNFINRTRNGTSQKLVTSQTLATLFVGNAANPAYGLGFWLNRPPPEPRLQSIKLLQLAIDGDQLYPGGPRDLVAAIGTSKQRLYMISSLDLVIVRFAYGASFSDGDFLSRLLTGKPHPDAHTH